MKIFMFRHSHRSSAHRPPRRPAAVTPVTQSSFIPPLLSAFALLVISTFAVSQDAPGTAPPQATPIADRISPPRHRSFRMPLYPASEREARTTGSVDISMLVSPEGRLVDIKSITSEPKNAVFEEVTKNAVAKWLFAPGLTRCVPVLADVTYRVSFEIAGGSDHVRAVPLLSQSQLAMSDARHQMSAPNENELRRSVRYPSDARRAGAQGSVYLMLSVNPVNGVIDRVDIASVNTTKEGFERDFSDSAIKTVRKFKFTPMPELKAPHKICVPFVFGLR